MDDEHNFIKKTVNLEMMSPLIDLKQVTLGLIPFSHTTSKFLVDRNNSKYARNSFMIRVL